MSESEASKRYREEMNNKWGDDDSSPEERKAKVRKEYKDWANSAEKLEYELDLQNKKVAAKLGWSKPRIVDKEDGVLIDGLMYTAHYWSDGTTTYSKM
jgi:hypothetical protein